MTKTQRRLFFVMMTDVIGGAELVTLSLAQAMSEHLDVTIASRPQSPLLSRARELSVSVAPLDLGPKLGRRTAVRGAVRFAFARRRLRTWLDDRLVSTDWCCLQYKWEELLWGGSRVRPRIILAEHGPIPRLVTQTRPLRRRLATAFAAADAVVAWSEPASDSIISISGRSPARVNAGVNIAAVRRAQELRDVRRRELIAGADRGTILIAYVGRLTADKGVGEVLAALPLIPEAVLVIAGDGPDRDRLGRLASELGVSERVRFLGHLADPLPTSSAADVAFLLTRSPGEGRPLASLECSAIGTPVIGLMHSAAMVALAAEGRVQLLRSIAPTDIAAAVQHAVTRPRAPIETPDWSSVASEFVEALERVDRQH